MLLSGIHYYYGQLETGFPPRNVAGMTEWAVMQSWKEKRSNVPCMKMQQLPSDAESSNKSVARAFDSKN
jgi:hypothetical protein